MNHIDPIRREIARFEPLDIMLSDVAVRIQLSATDYRKAVQRYGTISEWIEREESPLHGKIELVYPQGGFAIGATVARHATDDEFDIDGMAQLTLSARVDPEVPLSQLHDAIRGPAGSRYHRMTDRKTRCVTVNYSGMHLDLTPTVRVLSRSERTGLIFHSKPQEPQSKKSLWANPYGFADWFKACTPADEAFGTFFEERSLSYDRDRARMLAEAEADPVPDQLPAYRKSKAVIALQLIKRWRNLAFDRRYPQLRRPPSVLIAHYIALHANQTTSLADELIHQIEAMIIIFETAERSGRRVREFNRTCDDDELTDRWPESGADQGIFLKELRTFAEKLHDLRRGAPLPHTYKVLEELFGERPARAALDRYVGQHEADRIAGRNLHIPGIGRVPALGTAAAAPAARATPRNTFFGE